MIKHSTLTPILISEVIENYDFYVQIKRAQLINENGDMDFEVEEFDLSCADELDVCEALEMDFAYPVICEQEDVEGAISKEEYETLKRSDDRRFKENMELLDQIRELKTPWHKKLWERVKNGD